MCIYIYTYTYMHIHKHLQLDKAPQSQKITTIVCGWLSCRVVSTFSRCEKEILFEKVFRLLFEASCTYLQLHGIFSKPKRSEDGASNWNSLKVLLFKEHISKLCSFWETLKLLLHQKQLVSQVQLKCQTWGIPPLQSSQT